jgi:hypothetical protein
MRLAQSPAHYINSSKGCPSITESFPLVGFLVLWATVAALPVVQPHCDWYQIKNRITTCLECKLCKNRTRIRKRLDKP